MEETQAQGEGEGKERLNHWWGMQQGEEWAVIPRKMLTVTSLLTHFRSDRQQRRAVRARTGELVRCAFELLLSHEGGLNEEVITRYIEHSFPLVERERGPDAVLVGLKCFEARLLQGLIAPLKAGWLRRHKGQLMVSEEGRIAWERFQDPETFILEAGRRSIRGWVSVHFPQAYSSLGMTLYQLQLEYKVMRRVGLRYALAGTRSTVGPWQKVLPVQAPQRFEVPGVDFAGTEDLMRYLTGCGAAYSTGGHTLYLPPASVQATAFKTLMGGYPANSGLKIVKSPGGVDESNYVSPAGTCNSYLHRRATHPHRHLTLVANLLYSKGVGPRLFDLIQIECGRSAWTAYVVEHLGPEPPCQAACQEGLQIIQQLERQRLIRITIPDGYRDDEFQCPSCGGNALSDGEAKFRYVDFQNFLLVEYGAYLRHIAVEAAAASHFGDRSLLRGGKYLYQSVPGTGLAAKRGPEARMVVIQRLLEAAGISIAGRLVLDVGCNIGMMMAQYLRCGARWCHGWDRSVITTHTERLLYGLGCTRFSVSGADLDPDYPLESDLPAFLLPLLEGCAISYLAVRKHLGWLGGLGKIPWGFLIYEGHEGETRADFQRHIKELEALVRFEVRAVDVCEDGDSEGRIVAILARIAS